MKRILVSAAVMGAMIAPVLAQAPAATPAAPAARPAMPMVAGPAGPNPAMEIPADKQIPYAQALDAVQTAVDTCLKRPRTSAAAVAVVDLNGNFKVQLAPDGTGVRFFEFARRKAYTVLKKGVSSGEYGRSIGTPPPTAVAEGLEGDKNLIHFPGAFPIKKGNDIVGVMTVSGPTGGAEDEVCAQAGLAKIKF